MLSASMRCSDLKIDEKIQTIVLSAETTTPFGLSIRSWSSAYNSIRYPLFSFKWISRTWSPSARCRIKVCLSSPRLSAHSIPLRSRTFCLYRSVMRACRCPTAADPSERTAEMRRRRQRGTARRYSFRRWRAVRQDPCLRREVDAVHRAGRDTSRRTEVADGRCRVSRRRQAFRRRQLLFQQMRVAGSANMQRYTHKVDVDGSLKTGITDFSVCSIPHAGGIQIFFLPARKCVV